MKRKFALFNLALMALVQITIAFQSFHAFSHAHTTATQNHYERRSESKNNIVQDHVHDDESCSICDFHFDFFVAPQQFFLALDFNFIQIPYSYSSIESNTFFAGSLFALRAPPTV